MRLDEIDARGAVGRGIPRLDSGDFVGDGWDGGAPVAPPSLRSRPTPVLDAPHVSDAPPVVERPSRLSLPPVLDTPHVSDAPPSPPVFGALLGLAAKPLGSLLSNAVKRSAVGQAVSNFTDRLTGKSRPIGAAPAPAPAPATTFTGISVGAAPSTATATTFAATTAPRPASGGGILGGILGGISNLSVTLAPVFGGRSHDSTGAPLLYTLAAWGAVGAGVVVMWRNAQGR